MAIRTADVSRIHSERWHAMCEIQRAAGFRLNEAQSLWLLRAMPLHMATWADEKTLPAAVADLVVFLDGLHPGVFTRETALDVISVGLAWIVRD